MCDFKLYLFTTAGRSSAHLDDIDSALGDARRARRQPALRRRRIQAA
jgi:hypothetical protein